MDVVFLLSKKSPVIHRCDYKLSFSSPQHCIWLKLGLNDQRRAALIEQRAMFLYIVRR